MPDDPLRLVLFGLPGAGKSSLLGALGQAAEVQPRLLGGALADPSPNLADLRRRVYEHGPAPTDEEVVAYSFTYEPSEKSEHGRLTAVVLDCDGRVADALVREPAPAAGTLGREMLHADALVLAVDASAAAGKSSTPTSPSSTASSAGWSNTAACAPTSAACRSSWC